MAKGTTKHHCVGKRVEIPAYTDLWMQGARFGTVARVYVNSSRYLQAGDPRGADRFAVKLDNPQVKRLAWVFADDCRFVS